MATATKLAPKAQEKTLSQIMSKPREQAKAKEVATPSANPIFQIMVKAEQSPQEKAKQITNLLVATKDRAKNKELVAHVTQLKEYLAEVAKADSLELMEMQDTGVLAVLQQVIGNMTNEFNDYMDQVEPIQADIDAVYELRKGGRLLDAAREISDDRKRDAEDEAYFTAQEDRIHKLAAEQERLMRENDRLEQDKSFFGFGKTKASALSQITSNNRRLEEIAAELKQIAEQRESRKAETAARQSQMGDFKEQKERLRKMLDLGPSEQTKRLEKLRDRAISFVKTSDTELKAVREHVGMADKSIEHLGYSNGVMNMMIATLNEGLGGAITINAKSSQELLPRTGETDLDKLHREQAKEEIDRFVSSLNNVKVDTTEQLDGLTKESARIKAMQDSIQNGARKAAVIQTQGIAGIASVLASNFQARNNAALSEATSAAQEVLERMNQYTQESSQKEIMRNAGLSAEEAERLKGVLSSLEQYGETQRQAIETSREGMRELNEMVENIRKTAGDVTRTVRDSIGDTTAVVTDAPTRTQTEKKPAEVNPFALKD